MQNQRIDLDKPIPAKKFPDHNVEYENSTELLISIEELASDKRDRLLYSPVYFSMGIDGATDKCILRLGVWHRLLNALDMLPKEYGFKIFDAWRPFRLQQSLYHAYEEVVMKNNPQKTRAEIEKLVNSFVSIPVHDPEKPPVHTTGGSVDLTVIRLDTGLPLDMGTSFDYFGAKSFSDYFEHAENCQDLSSLKIRQNRRTLYNAMVGAGFSNLPSEWWHYDYGNAYWASSSCQRAFYRGVFK